MAHPADLMTFRGAFAALRVPAGGDDDFSVVMVIEGVFVARDARGAPAVLLRCSASDGGRPAPLRLDVIEVAYDVSCTIRLGSGSYRESLAVLRCLSGDPEIRAYFLDCLDAAVARLRRAPTRRDVVTMVAHLAALFAAQAEAPRREVQGLWGELLIIDAAPSPLPPLRCWRTDPTEKFDFAMGRDRIEVKTHSRPPRAHLFSFDQVHVPDRVIAVVASLHVRPMAGGLSLRALVDRIRQRLGASTDAIARLERIVAETMGSALPSALEVAFDYETAVQSLRFYPVERIPRVAAPLPPLVSDVSFRAELQEQDGLAAMNVFDSHPVFRDFSAS